MCVYFRRRDKVLVVVGVYVDDLLVTDTEREAVDAFFGELASLSVKGLGRAHKFLGIHVTYDEDEGYHPDQEMTIANLLKEHGMEFAHSVRAPIGEEWGRVASSCRLQGCEHRVEVAVPRRKAFVDC
ncbi:hypothetical protein PI124_g13808 [Phytophthora idaei]|nr:hypothetical protein PI124_g13808 [Phytophthora idaei]